MKGTDAVINLGLAREIGFPEAVVYSIIKEATKGKTKLVKLSAEEIHRRSHESVARSTVRAAVVNLMKADLIEKVRIDPSKLDDPMDRTCWYRVTK